MIRPKVCVLRSDGTNCDGELFYAFEKFGAAPIMVHVNELRNKSKKLKNFQILALPGGFSYGDDLASGKVLAVELISFLKEEIKQFKEKGNFILGICNGFQTLVRTGLLPHGNLGKMEATLAQNDSGHFECRWVRIKSEDSRCPFLAAGKILEIPVNHGEGKFFSSPDQISQIEKEQLVTFRYVDGKGNPTQIYPQNPNGSLNGIAGICDPTGCILGLMPHPEKFVDPTQHPNWRRNSKIKGDGAIIFENLIKFVKAK